MWQPGKPNLLSPSASHTQARTHAVVDLIQYTAASGKVARG